MHELREGGERLPPIITINAVPDFIIEHHVRSSLEQGYPEVGQRSPHERKMILAAPGPSLGDTWQDMGTGDIFTVGGAHDYLLDRGVPVRGWVTCDSTPFVSRYVTRPSPDVDYYIASHSHPFVFDALEDCNIFLWHAEVRSCTQDVLRELRPGRWTVVGGGSSVGTRALCLGYVLGYRKFEIHGMDGSCRDGVSHAGAQAAPDDPHRQLTYAGRTFDVPGNLIPQMQEWQTILTRYRFDIECHGDGLMQHMWRSHAS